jgi:uncharacterized protein YodC (DUF2158 family)
LQTTPIRRGKLASSDPFDPDVLTMTHFKSGDLVVLKSGGPTMTIDTVNTDIFDDDKMTGLLCVWFAGEVMHRVRFDHRAVKLVAPPQVDAPTRDDAAAPDVTTGTAASAKPFREAVAAAAPEAPAAPHESGNGESVNRESGNGDGAAPASEAPAQQVAPEATGDYAAVLDSMVGAMNAAAELLDPAPRPARRARTTPRAAARSKTTH